MYLLIDFKEQNYFVMLIIFLIINDFHLNLDCVSEESECTSLLEEDQSSEQTKNVTSAENRQGQFKVISLMVKCSCTYLEAY